MGRPRRGFVLSVCSSISKTCSDRQVDLVTDKALRSEFRPYVEREAVGV